MDLYTMAQQANRDSERWFPNTSSEPFFTAACMAGEVGEVLNHLKKVERGSHEFDQEMKAKVAEELADVFTYFLDLCGTLEIDIVAEYYKKREKNEERFGVGTTTQPIHLSPGEGVVKGQVYTVPGTEEPQEFFLERALCMIPNCGCTGLAHA